MKKLRVPMSAGNVTRYHTIRMIHKQSVAEHSWGVAMVILWLYGHEHVPASLMRAALLHDVAEVATGDMPAPVKWSSEQLSQAMINAENTFNEEHGLGDLDLPMNLSRILKFADMCELIIFCLGEANMGNREARSIARRGLAYLKDRGLVDVHTRSKQLFDSLEEQSYGI
jgi:5'-deoxynucleotidase YfbR-like HD superfamily hydrolase